MTDKLFNKKVNIQGILFIALLLSLMACGGGDSTETTPNGDYTQPDSNVAIVALNVTARSQIGREKEINLASQVITSNNNGFRLIQTPSLQAGNHCQIRVNGSSVLINSDRVDDCIYEYEVQAQNAIETKNATSQPSTAKGYLRVSFASTYEQNTLPMIVRSVNYNVLVSGTLVFDLINELNGAVNSADYRLNHEIILLGSGKIEKTGAHEITYTALEQTAYANILYSYTKKDGSDIQLGSIALSVSDTNPFSNATPVANSFDYDVEQVEVNVNTRTPIDVSAYISDPDDGVDQLQLVAIKATNAEVAPYDETDLYNKKFTFKSAVPGLHEVAYTITDHNGGYDTGIVNITVKPDFSVLQQWQDIRPTADYPAYGSPITFSAPMTKIVADTVNANYTDTHIEDGTYGNRNYEVVKFTYQHAVTYCSSRDARLPTTNEINYLLEQEGSTYNGVKQHNWPVSVDYWVAEKPTQDTARTVNLHSDTQVDTTTAVDITETRYVTCVLFKGQPTDNVGDYTIINKQVTETSIAVKVTMTGQLLDPEGNPAPYQQLDLLVSNSSGYLNRDVASQAQANEGTASVDLTEAQREVGTLYTDADGNFSFSYIDASFNNETIQVNKGGTNIGNFIFDPEDITGGRLDLSTPSKWNQKFYEEFVNNPDHGIDLSPGPKGIPLWKGDYGHDARIVSLYKTAMKGENFLGRIKVQQDGNYTPSLGRFVFAIQSRYNPNNNLDDSLFAGYRGATPGLINNGEQLGFVYDYNGQHMLLYYAHSDSAGNRDPIDINGSEPDTPPTGFPGNLQGLRQSTAYLWFRYIKGQGIKIYASQTPFRPEVALVDAPNVTFGASNSINTNEFYITLGSRIIYRPTYSNANEAYFESVTFSSWFDSDLD